MRALIAIAAALALAAGTAGAGPVEEGLAAFNRGDDAAAFRLFRQAAAQGNAPAQNNLGVMYRDGLGVKKNPAEAFKWFSQAAKGGNLPARANLGRLYAAGEGVRRDDVEAYKWFDLAAAGFPAGPARSAAKEARDEVAKRMTPDRIERARRLVRTWQPG